jgi:Na+/H+ antiporter NhaD/arsenite permease-like protein
MRRAASPLMRVVFALVVLCLAAFAASSADAAQLSVPTGADLALPWGLPFAGLLLSIALVPLASAHFWHQHHGKVAAAWVCALLVPFAFAFGATETVHQVAHAILLEYVPFVVILFALFTIAGGICVRGAFTGTPALNTSILALGATLASVMGTTGAAMLLIRPLLNANEYRQHKAHAVVFFVILVGNVGGALSPLGDPPLFIGFLKGVNFFWTARELVLPTAVLVGTLLAIFWLVDAWLYRKEPRISATTSTGLRFAIEGSINFLLIAGVIGAVLMFGVWDSGIGIDVLGAHLEVQNVLRDGMLVGLALLSLALTPKAAREHNAFHWMPIVEVAKIFAGIFVTIIPVIAMLGAGRSGALGRAIALVVDAAGAPLDTMFFWTTGALSAFLDNAPTYLVFFNLAGGDPALLMGPLRLTLKAISMGAVYFGALTYIGNAPNFMIKAIAEDRGVAMPSFFGYFGWASLVMLPLLAVITVVFL